MGFLKKLFNREPEKYVDKTGIYYHIECGRCKNHMQVRIDQRYDLNRTDNGFVWYKTLVCAKCFQQMPTSMTFDGKYHVVTQEIERGKYVSESDV